MTFTIELVELLGWSICRVKTSSCWVYVRLSSIGLPGIGIISHLFEYNILLCIWIFHKISKHVYTLNNLLFITLDYRIGLSNSTSSLHLGFSNDVKLLGWVKIDSLHLVFSNDVGPSSYPIRPGKTSVGLTSWKDCLG